MRAPSRTIEIVVRVAGILFGVFLVLAGVAALWVDAMSVDQPDLISCEVPGGESEYGDSSWSWLPPGKECTYPGGSTGRPVLGPEVVALVAIVGGAGLTVSLARGFATADIDEEEGETVST